MINAKLQNLYNIKNDIGTAIVNKGGTITESTPFYSYAGQIDNISTGTPQTVFQDSTGAKWARTNAVNLTNVSNNVTSDFNWWQPANNTTSDAILNVGTVGANISGNIRLVPVNQVNIAQYGNIIAQANNGAKFVGFNGYDATTNPTPTGNTTFNRWLLNNSATGTIIFANATIVNGGTYNGPNLASNQFVIPFVANSASRGGRVQKVETNNGFIYAAGRENFTIQKYHESNLSFVGNTASYGASSRLTVNNGFIYVCGEAVQQIRKYHESNLETNISSETAGLFDTLSIVTNNGFVYVSGANFSGGTFRKYHESNLVFSATISPVYGSVVEGLAINNGFVYAVGRFSNASSSAIRKYHESNLVLSANSAAYGGTIKFVTINNGFLYVGGITNQTVQKFHESNLAFVGNTNNYNGDITGIATNNGFIYVSGFGNEGVKKYFESNLSFVNNTISAGPLYTITTNNGFIYTGGDGTVVSKFEEAGLSAEQLTFYNISKIKE